PDERRRDLRLPRRCERGLFARRRGVPPGIRRPRRDRRQQRTALRRGAAREAAPRRDHRAERRRRDDPRQPLANHDLQPGDGATDRLAARGGDREAMRRGTRDRDRTGRQYLPSGLPAATSPPGSQPDRRGLDHRARRAAALRPEPLRGAAWAKGRVPGCDRERQRYHPAQDRGRDAEHVRLGDLARAKTPVSIIKGYAETLAREDAKWNRKTLREGLHVIGEEADRLARQIGDLLEVSRLQSDGMRLEQTEWQLPALAAQVTERFAAQAGDGFQFELRFPDDMPSVYADYERTRAVLENLISNAV